MSRNITTINKGAENHCVIWGGGIKFSKQSQLPHHNHTIFSKGHGIYQEEKQGIQF